VLIRAAGVYVVAAVLLTWPLAVQFTTHLGALEGEGDPFLNLWILGWGMQAWLGDPAAVLNGRVFDANIFHPAAGTLTFSDHLLLQSLVASPLYALTGSLTISYNTVLLASLVLSGLSMHMLARFVTGSERAAFVAGVTWMCWPYRTAHLLHLQLQALYFLPLALWALLRVAAARRWRDAALLGLFAALQAISSVYYGVMTAIAIGVSAIAVAWTTGQWRAARFWSRVAGAAAIGAMLIAPVAWPYWITQQREGFGRNLFEAVPHSASLQSYTQVPPENLLYGRTGLLLPREPEPGARDRRSHEHQMFPGVVLVGLAAFGFWKGRRTDSRPVVVASLALAITGVVFSLGPEGVRAIYAAAADLVFGFHAIRAPARFATIAMAGACLLASVGVARSGWRALVVAVITVLLMAEYVNAPLPLVAAPETSTPAGRWLRDSGTPGAVLYLPLSLDKANSTFMVQSLEHRRPIVNGYSGQRPSYYTSLVDAFANPSSADARTLLKELDVRYVVSPDLIADSDHPGSPYVERETFGDTAIYEVVWTETSEAALEVLDAAAPPPPGPIPFRRGETATYEVKWLTGPLDLVAGTITLTVAPPEADDGGIEQAPTWAFEASAVTAPWMSRFFEARDRFRTSTTAALLPLVHRRYLREGRRVTDRAYVYDHDGRHVRSADSVERAREGSAMSLPLAAHARDSLAALWYVRTLALEPGSRLELPINDGGRNMTASVTVVGRERVDAEGRTQDAVRFEPVISTRVQRRQPVRATIWISADDRRVPLAADIAAGFGRLSLKLVDYRP
jgi:hypothetical protein